MTVRVDPVLVGQLARWPGADGQDLGTELVARFTESLVTLLPRLRSLVAAGDAATLVLDSHSLRGSAAMLGAVSIAQLAKTIEANALAGELEGARALVDALESEWLLAQPELQAACAAAASAAGARPDRDPRGPGGRGD